MFEQQVEWFYVIRRCSSEISCVDIVRPRIIFQPVLRPSIRLANNGKLDGTYYFTYLILCYS